MPPPATMLSNLVIEAITANRKEAPHVQEALANLCVQANSRFVPPVVDEDAIVAGTFRR